MKKSLFIGLMGLALCLSSCVSVRETAVTVPVDTHVSQYPTVADLEVMAKASSEVEWYNSPFNTDRTSFAQRMRNLEADLLDSKGADVLLEPQFKCTKRRFGLCRIEVTGYPAKFKDFRKATPEDLEALKASCPAKERKVYDVSQPWYKKIGAKFKKK